MRISMAGALAGRLWDFLTGSTKNKSIEFTYIKRTQVTDDLRASTHMDVRFDALAHVLIMYHSMLIIFQCCLLLSHNLPAKAPAIDILMR